MTKAQKRTLDQMRKKRQLQKLDYSDHKTVGEDVHVVTKDGDDLAIRPNGLAVPR